MSVSTPKAQPVKKRFGKRFWLLLALLSCLIVGGLIYLGNTIRVVTTIAAGAGSREELLPDTINLPDVDRVEIESIESNPDGQVTKVLASNELYGENANEFAKLWRAQNYVFGENAMCHEPGYRLKFYQRGFLFVTATICFACENIYFNESLGVHFQAKTDAGKKLRSYLAGLFPGHDKEAP